MGMGSTALMRNPSGHVFRVARKRGPVWYAKYRLPDGRQVQRRLGPAWTARGRPPAGYFTKRLAEDWLRDTLDQARRGTLAGMVRTGATVADAAAEYLRYLEQDRARSPNTVGVYRWVVEARILPVFGARRLEEVTTSEVESWLRALDMKPSTKAKALMVFSGIFKRARKVYGLPVNPAVDVEKPSLPRGGDIHVFSPEEVWALVRSAAGEQDAAIFLTAAFTGLRMGELLALRWRDVDFDREVVRARASYTDAGERTTKSGRVRSIPLALEVAEALSRLRGRAHFTGDDDLVFAGEAGGHVDRSALRRRYKASLGAAGLRPLRFHDLRHTFGTRMIGLADIRRVQEWMGHADIQTTMRYLHYAPRPEDAELVSRAFRPAEVGAPARS